MKLIIGIILGFILGAIIVYSFCQFRQKILVSDPISANVVSLVKNNDESHTKFSVFRDKEKLFSASIVSNSFFLRVPDSNAPIDKMTFNKHLQEGITTYKLTTSMIENTSDIKTVEYDMESGEIMRIFKTSDSGAKVYDRDGNELEINREQDR